MSSSRRPSTAPGPSRDTSLKAPKSSRGSFWSFGSPDKRGSGGSTAPGLNTMAQTHANGPISTSLSLQPSFSDDHERFRPTPTDRSTKSRRTSFFRSAGYASDDNGDIRGGGHRDKRSELLIAQGSAVRVGKTQLQSTPEEAQEVSDFDFQPVPELERARRAQFLRSISSPSFDINTHEVIRSTSGGNLQSPPSRSRSGSSSLSRPPPSPSSYAVYTPSVLLPSIAPSNSSSSLTSSLSQHGTLAPVGPSRPERNPARLPQGKLRRPSTASGVLEGRFAREMMQPLAVPYLHPVKSSTHSPLKSKKSSDIPNGWEKSQFSTADRTILAELKENLTARNSQFVQKNGKKHHPYSAKEVPYPRNYERIVLDHEMWETLFYQELTKDVTFHRFETPPSKALDIGCGSGAWILNASRVWKQTHFVGLDIVPIHPDLTRVGSTDLANRISWVQANFLEGLPFPNEEFDFVMVKRIARGVPEDKWDALLEEILRVMKPGGAIEVVEEDLYFPGSMSDPLILAAGSTVSNASTSDLSTASTNSHDNPTPAPPLWTQSSPTLVSPYPRTKRLSEPTDQTPKRMERNNGTVGTVQAEKLRSSVSASELGRSRFRGGGGHDESGMVTSPYMGGLTEGVEVGPDRGSKDAGLHARSKSREHFGVTTSTTSASLLEIPAPSLQRPKTAQPFGSPRSPGRKRGLSASRVGPPISGIPPSPPLPFQLQQQNNLSSPEQAAQINPHAQPDVLPASPPEQRIASLFRTPTRGKKTVEKSNEDASAVSSFKETPIQPENPRMLYRPSPRTLINPRDHSLLERIYCEMHEARFINLTPLAILAAQLCLYFKHVKSHAPISFTFPPKPKKKYVLEQTKPGAQPWSDDEDDPLFPHFSEDETASAEKHDLSRRTSKRALDKAEDTTPQYVVVDNARLPASAPRTSKARAYTESIHSTASSDTISAISPSRSVKSFRAFAVSVSPDRSQPDTKSLIEPRPQIRTQISVPSSQGKALDIDLRSLHMHLATRVGETLACAEAMWEWVVAEQQRHAAERASGRGRARSVGEDADEETDAQMKAIREMTRADFDACLSRFEMDMHDNIALNHAIEQHLNWKPSLAHARTAERKSFETSCAIWDAQLTSRASDADGESEKSSTGSGVLEQPQTRFSRTFRIFAAWKEEA